MGDRGWRGRDSKGAKSSWLMLFYDTWSQLTYVLSYLIGRGGGGGRGKR